MKTSVSTVAVLALAALTGIGAVPLKAEEEATAEESLPVRYQATALNMSEVGRRGTARLDILIERWSTPAERGQLMEAMKESGRRSLANALGRRIVDMPLTRERLMASLLAD